MVKFIGNWMFASQLFKNAKPSPIAINLQEVQTICERYRDDVGIHVVIISNTQNCIPIEGDIVEIMAAFQKHLLTL